MITQHRVKELFNYTDGCLYWKVKPSNGIQVGDEAGYIQSDGYRRIKINGEKYKASRLIFLMHKGYLPNFVDHNDTDRSNDRIDNLRECTLSNNQHNRNLGKNNTSGIKGVYWNKKAKKWHARIKSNNKNIHVGLFLDIHKAEIAIKQKRVELHGEYYNHG